MLPSHFANVREMAIWIERVNENVLIFRIFY